MTGVEKTGIDISWTCPVVENRRIYPFNII